jgi:hypothetical protein
MGNKYIRFKDGKLLEGPCELPSFFELEDGRTMTSFHLLEKDAAYMLTELNWYLVDDPPVEFDPDYQTVVYSAWFIEKDIAKRNHVVLYLDWSTALTIAYKKLDANRIAYEVGGFKYTYFGIPVIIMSDKDSQADITASYIKAVEGTRLSTDVWRFIKEDDKSMIVVQLSNEIMIDISELVYRNIQDSYNVASATAWQMLGTGTTEELQRQINEGIINLNPWDTASKKPWPLEG